MPLNGIELGNEIAVAATAASALPGANLASVWEAIGVAIVNHFQVNEITPLNTYLQTHTHSNGNDGAPTGPPLLPPPD